MPWEYYSTKRDCWQESKPHSRNAVFNHHPNSQGYNFQPVLARWASRNGRSQGWGPGLCLCLSAGQSQEMGSFRLLCSPPGDTADLVG